MFLSKKLADYKNPRSLGYRLRKRRAGLIKQLIEECGVAQKSILDVGGTETYWNIFDPDFLRLNNVRITLLNLSEADIKDPSIFSSMVGDATNLAKFSEGSFDIVHSNSVIEHVGPWPRVKRFAAEVRRVGKRYYVQTPNFWFPLEPHYLAVGIHWLPRSVRVKLLQRRSIGHFEKARNIDEAVNMIDSVELLDRSMFTYLFHDAQIITERFLRLPKSLIAVRRNAVLETEI